MCRLNEHQVALIMDDVESTGINYSHLSTDLVDHICCDIESYMDDGVSFEDAYRQIQQEFGIKGLQQIQHDTLMLIDKNYRIMKKSMKTIGVIALSLMAFGALFKIFHWPGASIILALSFIFTTLVFFPSLMFIMHKEVNDKKHGIMFLTTFIGGAAFMSGVLFKIMHWPGAQILLITGISFLAYLLLPMIVVNAIKLKRTKPGLILLGALPLIIYITGLMFKLNHWPGATILLTLGSLTLILIYVPAYYRTEIKKSSRPRVDFLFAIIALSYFIIFSFLLQVNLSRKAGTDLNLQNQSFHETANYFRDLNQASAKQSTTTNKLLAYTNEIETITKEIKTTVVMLNCECNQVTALSLLNTNEPLINPFKDITNITIPGNNSAFIRLSETVENYCNFYKDYPNYNHKFYADLLEFSDLFKYFHYQTAISALQTLSLLEYQVQLCNYTLLKSENLTLNNQ